MRRKTSMESMASVIFRAIESYKQTLPPRSADLRIANRLLLDFWPQSDEDVYFIERALDRYVKSLPVTNPDVGLGINTLDYLKIGAN